MIPAADAQFIQKPEGDHQALPRGRALLLSRVFGFELADPVAPVAIDNL